MKKLKQLFVVLFAVGLYLSGCLGNAKSNWETSPTFTDDHIILHGVQGVFGIVKVNGEDDEPEFLVDKGRLYQVYFLKNILMVKGTK